MADYAALADQWMQTDCAPKNNWCNGADLAPAGDPDGAVNLPDLMPFVADWLGV